MGVQIAEILPKEKIETENLAHKIIAIDAFNWLYQFLSSIRQYDGTPLKDSKGNITSHLSGLFYRTTKLIEKGVKPVYVFDGEPPKFKAATTDKRKSAKEEAKEKLEKALEMGDMEEVKKQAQRTSELTEEMVKESKLLLDAIGLPVIQAKSEGEAQCAAMCSNGDVYSTASQDSDSLLFGSPRLVRNLNITGKKRVRGREIEISPEMIRLEDVLKELDINRDQLIIMGILVGTDYNIGGIKGIGPKKAIKLVKEYKTFDKIFRNIEWAFEIKPEEIFEFFKNPLYNKYEIKFKRPDEEKIKKILCDEHDFSEERVNNSIKKLEATSQRSLDSWLK